MAYLPVVTVAFEGGYYIAGRRADHPIRIYPDRWVEDDIFARCMGRIGKPLATARPRRERLTRAEFREVKRAAAGNRKAGRN